FSYRLRTLLAAVTVVAMVWGVWHRLREHNAAFEVLAKAEHVLPALAEPTWLDRITHANLNRITHVSFHGVRNIGDQEVAQLRRCPQLQRLSLHRTDVTDHGLAYLAQCEKLLVLSLKHTQVTDLGLAHLSELVHLK